jgi:hypothetical protein
MAEKEDGPPVGNRGSEKEDASPEALPNETIAPHLGAIEAIKTGDQVRVVVVLRRLLSVSVAANDATAAIALAQVLTGLDPHLRGMP